MNSVLSLQVGRVAPLGPDHVPSAFIKKTVTGPIRAATLGLAGDEQADHSVHGGPDKAIYFYPSELYPRWSADAPAHQPQFFPGSMGENVTTVGLSEQTVAIGDVFAIGTAAVQVTQPRQPCFKLGLRYDDNSLGKIMMQTGRTGWYVKVIQEGEIAAGNAIAVVRRSNPAWSIARFNQFLQHRSTASPEDLKELLHLDGLPEGWKVWISERATNLR